MRTQRWFVCGMSLMMILAMFATSCGGGTTVTPVIPTDPPVNSGFPQSTSPDVVAEPISGASSDAPLGTNPDYSMTPIVPVDVSGAVTSRLTSALQPGQDYAVRGASVTASNITNPNLVNFVNPTNLQFNEGTNVNLWVQYEVRANTTFQWTWSVSASGNSLYNFVANRTETTAGVKTFYMTLFLPLDETSNADKPATFTISFADKVGSLVIIPPDENMATVGFLIKNVPVIVTEYGNEGGAYMCWEDLLVNSDYDYNDFVGGLYAKELMRQSDGKVLQISFVVKAIARGAGYDSDWQFNMDSAFPGATATAYIQRYTHNGTPKGSLQAWASNQGTSIPVFVSNKTSSLPVSPNGDGFSTNVRQGSTWVNGDYAHVTIIFNNPLTPGTFTPIPYRPQLRVRASSTNIYTIGLWARRGDPVDSNKRPLGFVIPGNFAWPLEGRRIWFGYPRFNDWITWINNMSLSEASQPLWWNDAPVLSTNGVNNVYRPQLFGGSPPALPVLFPKP
jgi:hypothetical protein